MIVDGNDYLGAGLGALTTIALVRSKGTYIPDAVEGDPVGPPLQARVDHSRWIVECECKSAQFVHKDDPRFFCIKCFNIGVGGRWRIVELPPNPDAIEEVLILRPEKANRNWFPGETITDLADENQARGLPRGFGDL